MGRQYKSQRLAQRTEKVIFIMKSRTEKYSSIILIINSTFLITSHKRTYVKLIICSSNGSSSISRERNSRVQQRTLFAYKSVWLLSHTVLWLLSNMMWNWNAQPMKSCRFSAYHWLTKPTCMTCSTRLISMMSKI